MNRQHVYAREIQAVLDHGHPFKMTIAHEGSVESGPYATESNCLRFGRMFLKVTKSGHLLYERAPRRDCYDFDGAFAVLDREDFADVILAVNTHCSAPDCPHYGRHESQF